MYTMEEILARLRNGDKDEDIANEMAKALNAAVDAYAKESERIQKEKEIEARKNELAETFSQVLFEYLRLENPDAACALETPDSAKIAREVLDMSIEAFADAFNVIGKIDEFQKEVEFSNENSKENTPKCGGAPIGKDCPHDKCKKNAVDPIDEFLRMFGLK